MFLEISAAIHNWKSLTRVYRRRNTDLPVNVSCGAQPRLRNPSLSCDLPFPSLQSTTRHHPVCLSHSPAHSGQLCNPPLTLDAVATHYYSMDALQDKLETLAEGRIVRYSFVSVSESGCCVFIIHSLTVGLEWNRTSKDSVSLIWCCEPFWYLPP